MKHVLTTAFLITALIPFFSCEKQVQTRLPKEVTESNLFQGPCPYDCHDVRCKGYSSGYCGPGVTTPPDQLPMKTFVAMTGTIHNNALSYVYNYGNTTYINGLTTATNIMTAISNYYLNQQGGMTIPYKTDIINYTANILNNVPHYYDGKAEDSTITSLINQIAPTRTTDEKNLLLSALNIYHFNTAGMTNDQVCDMVISRATALQNQYNAIAWTTGNGGCIGGYLNIAINSAMFWKYVYDNGVPPADGGANAAALARITPELTQAAAAPNLRIWGLVLSVGLLQVDAGAYLWGWGKSYFGGEKNENTRIKAGLSNAAEASSMGIIKN